MSITRLTTNGLTGTKYDTVSADNYYMEPIATVLVGSGGTANITFSNIPQGYKNLQIRGIARCAVAGTYDNFICTFNGDTTTTNYYTHGIAGIGSGTPSTLAIQNTDIQRWADFPGATETANIYGAFVVDILDYSNVYKFKTSRSLAGYDTNSSNGRMFFRSSLWINTAPVTTIKMVASSATNFTEHSRISLYGIKG